MGTPEPLDRSLVAYLSIRPYLTFEHDTAMIADDDQPKWRGGFTGFCATEEVHHLGSQAAGYILITQGVRRSRPWILDLRLG
jgi:hypothetical protein